MVEFHAPPVEPLPGPPALIAEAAVLSPSDTMRSWSVANVRAFLYSRDLRGVADVCFASAVNGEDLCSLDAESMAAELRLTPFQAKKLVAARNAFWTGSVGDGRSGR